MPQMFPINWLMLYIMFITIFLIINMLNYFMMKYKLLSEKKMYNKIKFNWKW